MEQPEYVNSTNAFVWRENINHYTGCSDEKSPAQGAGINYHRWDHIHIISNFQTNTTTHSSETDGEIQVFIEHSTDPIAVWKDPQPLPIQYFGFASYDNLVQFYYNCQNDEPQTYGITELQKSCDMYKTQTYEYRDFIAIPTNQPEGYRLSFLTYIKGSRDAHILLTEKTDTNTLDFDDLYEIRKSCPNPFRRIPFKISQFLS